MQSEAGSRAGVLLVNLGTPDAPTASAVKRYLREFLSDPRVVEVPRLVWWFILNLLILPFRSGRSAAAYRSIWTDKGSPLLVFSSDLAGALQEHLAREWTEDNVPEVGFAMRYGRPGIAAQLDSLRDRGVAPILILPLYPQYASATTASTFDAVFATLRQWRYVPEVRLLSDYHDDPGYIDAVATSIEQFWKTHGSCDKLLFSFHGLPERSRALGDPYHDQCHTTARLIAEKLGLPAGRWQLVFQSRFGPAEWLKPYCVDVLAQLPASGCREVDLVCPGFAVDCLETLEEIAVANRKLFIEAGGTRYRYIPALNSSPLHVTLLSSLIRRALGPSR